MQIEIDKLKLSMNSVPGDIPPGTIYHISQLTVGGTIVGGQNEQAQRKLLNAG